MPCGVHYARLPDEEPEFLDYLNKTGDIWARARADDPVNPAWPPAPIGEFLANFAAEIEQYAVVKIFFGMKDDVLHPVVRDYEATEGGELEPAYRNGEILPGVHKIVGGEKVIRQTVHYMASPLIAYTSGRLREPNELAASNLAYYTGRYVDGVYVHQPQAFQSWAGNVISWIRRRVKKSVRVYRANYDIRASQRVYDACRSGLRVR